MMLGVSGLMGNSGDGAAAAESGGASGGSSEVGPSSSIPGGGAMEELSERSTGGGGNRWPRQETLALLKIRSDMDVTFKDASLKGPLWEEVSRKMAERGFQRSAKKCKEKFENVFKYNKRTKGGRSSKPNGKTYRFFDQLEALENTPPNPTFTPPPPPPASIPTAAPASTTNIPPQYPSTTVTSTSPTPLCVVVPPNATNNSPTSFQPPHPSMQPPPQVNAAIINNPTPPPQIHHHFQQATHHQPHMSMSLPSNSTSSSTSSDEDIQRRRRGRKRKWKDYFERLMREVVHKQEQLQKNFLETLEKRERDRIAREEAWRVQEMARMNREHELLVQEKSIAAAKDSAVIAFLQKVTDQQIPIGINSNPPPPMQAQAPPIGTPQPPQKTPPPPDPTSAPPPAKMADVISETDNSGGGDGLIAASASRWPKAEVQALIDLRTSLDLKYQDSGPKGPLWEEISVAMAKLGYNRSSKRCKEKWENINKYFKKVKESNKRRPEDSKTCPYFHQLEAIYKEREKYQNHHNAPSFNPENPMVPIMARPEQQWPPVTEQRHDNGSENSDDDVDDEEEDEGGGNEIIANKQQQAASLANNVPE